jgi:phosphoglycolate phosphatase-like HAD superfamily hydrolase
VPIVLFDIDGTLVRTGGAGTRAMNRAFQDVFGIASAFDGISMAGRTDKWILQSAAARARMALGDSEIRRFRDKYVSRLVEALPEEGSWKGILPGVENLLSALGSRADIFPALLTGNCERGAQIKLEYFDLWRYFRCGAYGDDVDDRNQLLAMALRRAQDCGFATGAPHEVVVVGDTIHDVACARAAGARSIAVATGPFGPDELVAGGADVVVQDLGDTEALVGLLSTSSVQI